MLEVPQKQGFAEFDTGSVGLSKCAALRKICLTVGTFAATFFGLCNFPPGLFRSVVIFSCSAISSNSPISSMYASGFSGAIPL
jgi:hypothetical protein